ncbi:hypothetical protein [Microcoleus sp. AT9b-C3]
MAHIIFYPDRRSHPTQHYARTLAFISHKSYSTTVTLGNAKYSVSMPMR